MIDTKNKTCSKLLCVIVVLEREYFILHLSTKIDFVFGVEYFQKGSRILKLHTFMHEPSCMKLLCISVKVSKCSSWFDGMFTIASSEVTACGQLRYIPSSQHEAL